MSYAVIRPLGAPPHGGGGHGGGGHGGGGGGHGGGGHGGGGHGGGGHVGPAHGHRRPININVNAGQGFGPGFWPGYNDGAGYLYAVEDEADGVTVYVKQDGVWNPVAQNVSAEQAKLVAQTWTAKGFEVKIG
jgi:hypothetical protein